MERDSGQLHECADGEPPTRDRANLTLPQIGQRNVDPEAVNR